VVNILGDVLGAGIVNHLCRGFLDQIDEEEAKKSSGDLRVGADPTILPKIQVQSTAENRKSAAYMESEHL
jgi:hypothetical protein